MNTNLVISEIKIAMTSITKILYQFHPTYNRRVSSHRVPYLYSVVHIIYVLFICTIIYTIDTNCLKITVAMFHFSHSKNPSNVMKNILNSFCIHYWQKISLLINVREMCFDVMKNDQIYPLKVFHFQYDHRFTH